jgi:uncharacterized protein
LGYTLWVSEIEFPLAMLRPPLAQAALLLAHGAGAGSNHWFMVGICQALAQQHIATARFDFAYVRAGRKIPDRAPSCEREVRVACAAVHTAWPDLPLFAGGKSMGGRMTSQAEAHEPLAQVRGIVFLGFPLHPSKQPAVARAEHLHQVKCPMLFLQGQRDALADLTLLEPLVAQLPTATLTVIADADHGFEVPKRAGKSRDQIFVQLAANIRSFCQPYY